MYVVRKFTEAIIYSNVFIGLCAVALSLTNQLAIEGNVHFDKSLGFVFFSTMFTYGYLKFKNAGTIGTHTVHSGWAEKHPQLSRNVILISLIATIFYFAQLDGRVELMVAGLAVFTAFYGFVNIPFTNPKKKLRDFGLLKTLFVAIVWSVSTVIVPLGDVAVDRDMMLFLLVRRFLFVLALTIPFEIKDIAGDTRDNLKTLPLTIGVANTKLVAQGILFGLMMILAIQYFFFDLSLSHMLAVNLSLLVAVFCIQYLKEETKEWYYYVVLDGMMILQFILVYVATLYFNE
jgi:4-hydroxybenzoate polyprenyltransferase